MGHARIALGIMGDLVGDIRLTAVDARMLYDGNLNRRLITLADGLDRLRTQLVQSPGIDIDVDIANAWTYIDVARSIYADLVTELDKKRARAAAAATGRRR